MRYIKQICKGISERYHIGFDEDHVHLMIRSVLNYSPSKIFQVVKSITAIKLFDKYPDLKKDLCIEEFWSDVVFVGIVDEGINAGTIRNYIKN